MSIQGGPNMRDMEPLVPVVDDLGKPLTLGCHRGPAEALNIRRPEPGFTYYYPRAKAKDVLRFVNQGWELLTTAHKEEWGADLGSLSGTPLDTTQPYQDVVPMRIPTDRLREINAEKAELAKAALEGPDRTYMEKGVQRTAQLGRYAPKSEVYYRTRDHGMFPTSEE